MWIVRHEGVGIIIESAKLFEALRLARRFGEGRIVIERRI